MKIALLTAVAAIALSLGAATASHAASPAEFSGISIEKGPAVVNTGCYYQYYYVYNGYGYVYQYRYICY